MPIVTLSGTDYPVYADLATAGEYLAADAQYAEPWAAADVDETKRLLVSATRAIQAMRVKDDVDSDPTGTPPDAFGPASILFAAEGLANPGIFSARDTGPVVLEQQVTIPGAGGGVRKRFGYAKRALPMPNAVLRLLSPYLASGITISAGAGGTSGQGGSKVATLSDDFGYTGATG